MLPQDADRSTCFVLVGHADVELQQLSHQSGSGSAAARPSGRTGPTSGCAGGGTTAQPPGGAEGAATPGGVDGMGGGAAGGAAAGGAAGGVLEAGCAAAVVLHPATSSEASKNVLLLIGIALSAGCPGSYYPRLE